MSEVPIIFPSRASPPRFVVNDADCTIKRSQTKTGSGNEKQATQPLLDDVNAQAIHCGSASMSSLSFHASRTSAILTTSVLLESPRVLSVALAGNNPDSPVIVELDLGPEINVYGTTVKVQAFVEARNGQECIRLVLVADNAVIITMRLHPSNLAPFDSQPGCVEVLNVRDFFNEDPAMKDAVQGSLIHKTMVAFYSPTSLVLALSPLLMSVDLKSKTYEVWLESQCIEDMKARESTITSVLSKASELFLGRLDEGALVDMAPTAAVCVSTTGSPLLDPTFVFTLHSDGKIKRWRVIEGSLRPVDVYSITIEMPNPRDWSDMYNSVYLSARLYGQVYVLAVHVQSSSGSTLDPDENSGSSSHIYTVYGGKDNNVQNGEALELAVPNDAVGLVDMDFSPIENCSLTAMFRSITNRQYGAPTTLTVQYPASVVSIISTQPDIAPIEYFLDGVAQSECDRIRALVFNDELEGIASTSSLPLEDEIHEMDCRFMKYLFRPAYPRGSGTVTAPSDFHIRNSIQKLVYGRARKATEEGAVKSIQLETLRAIQELRIKENRQFQTASPVKNKGLVSESNIIVERAATKPSAMSVYDSYVAYDDGEEDDEMEQDEDVDQIEREREFHLEAHSRRWRKLLMAIWTEEQSLRSPLGFFLLADSTEGGAVLVRSGFTSILAGNECGASDNPLAQLDKAALKLIQALESDDDSRNKLFATEQRIWNNMVKAQLDETTPSDFAEECSRVVDFAFDSGRGAVFSVREQHQLGQALGTIPLQEYFVLLQDIPHEKELSGLNLVDTSLVRAARGPTTPRNIVANSQVRHAVCSLSVRCMDSSRRLLLARYLLVSYLVRSSEISTVAFFTYLRSLAVMWAGSQHVNMPTAFAGSSSAKNLRDQPPKKRLSFGDSSSSILANSTMTTCMDSLLISVLQSRSNPHEASPIGLLLSLCQDLFCSSMGSTLPNAADVATGKLHLLLPELSALPPSSNPSVATDHPRLALRLIAPLVGLDGGQVAPNVATARKETLAECLLLEAHKQSSDAAKSKMRIKACELLASNHNGFAGNLQDTMDAFGMLIPKATQQLSDGDIHSLANKLQVLVYGPEGEIRSDIARLVKLDTAKTLFGCLLREEQRVMTSDVDGAVKHLLPKMLQLSNMMHRVGILEHHVGRSKGSNDFILNYINGAIRELNDLFPSEVRVSMPENLSLYGSLFHNAVSSGEWNQAYDACLNNPSFARKVSNFKRLVNSMVDAGALQALMDKCASLAASSRSSAESVDLYSTAVDALEEACSRDLYLVRAIAREDASKAAPDYQGCLYSLHAARGEWRRAAQSLDLRYVNAIRALGTRDQSQSSETAAFREKLIVEDIVLASVGTTNAAALIDDAAGQYIVSGEQGQLPSIQVDVLTASESSAAKRRHPSEEGVPQEPSSLDRIAQFMTLQDLQGRCAWSFGLRKLCLDVSANFSLQASALLEENAPCVDKRALDELSEYGYYLNFLLVALAMSKTGSFTGRLRNAFQDSLVDLLSETLVPMSTDVDFSSSKVRPSPSQIRGLLDSICNVPGSSSYIAGCRSKNHSTAIQTCLQDLSAELMKKLVKNHTSAEHPVALHVATCILESDDRIAQLPCWLERLMMVGSSTSECVRSGDLFDRRPRPGAASVYLGDPSALLTLYLRQGMLLEACHVVVEALAWQIEGDGAGTAHPRLPEKGDVVFVPYKKIDVLWNLIDGALGKSSLDEATREKLSNGQDLLVQSLKKHLEVIKANEVGLRSARVVVRSTLT